MFLHGVDVHAFQKQNSEIQAEKIVHLEQHSRYQMQLS